MNEALALHNSETLKHVNKVREKLWILIQELDKRAQVHDASKFEEPEASVLAQNLPLLDKAEYGSPQYQESLEKVKPALDNHYAKNRHHPQHFENGISEMDLLDILEMLVDWTASTERVKNGNIHKSIEKNKERFGISDQLAGILRNTVDRYFK